MDLTFSEIFSTLTKTCPVESGLITIELTRIIQSLYYVFFSKRAADAFLSQGEFKSSSSDRG